VLRAEGKNHQKGARNPNTPGPLNKEFELRLGQRASTPTQNNCLNHNSRSTQGYSCNQRGDNIAVSRVNRKSGGLAFTGHYTPVGNPSIIVFLDLAKVD
jgi:6-phosphogluconolactonase (cycloisomerase 2 family)